MPNPNTAYATALPAKLRYLVAARIASATRQAQIIIPRMSGVNIPVMKQTKDGTIPMMSTVPNLGTLAHASMNGIAASGRRGRA